MRTQTWFWAVYYAFRFVIKAKLAQADIHQVKAKLNEQGYYVQAPPSEMLAAQAAIKAQDAQDKQFD